MVDVTVTAEPIEVLRTRTSEKWTAYPSDVLPLFVAETDYPLAPAITRALTAAIGRGDTGYAAASPELADAFVEFAQDRWGWRVDPADVVPTTDVSVVIVETLRRVIRPGEGVIIMPPVYPPFFELIPEAGGRVVEVPLLDDGSHWTMDLAGIEDALAGGRARSVLLCHPHNPLGLVHSPEQLRALADLAAAHDAIVVSDEIHAPLAHADAAFTPFLSVSDAARSHGIAAHAASKAWNLAGLKCALFVTAHERTRAIVAGMPDEVQARTGLFGVLASVAAYGESTDWLDGAIGAIESNRRLLGTLLAERMPEVGYREPAAGYLAWLDLRALRWGDDPAAVALERARVALVSGPTFGAQGAGFARLNFACSPEVLTEAIGRIATASASGPIT